MKYPNYTPQELEPQILEFWTKNKILETIRKKNIKGEKFYFLQGPPYTSGKLHLGHAWNHALKDMVLRYKRLNGFNVWDRNGYDMHGLPTERKVMDKFGLKFKQDIEQFGVEKFSQECMKWSTDMVKVMDQDLQRLGITLDYFDPYLPVTNEYMEGCWWLVKKAHQQKRLYLGERTISWCANCETAIAKHECEYKTVEEPSIFVKFPRKGKKDEYLIIWTTTPWTMAFNLAIMVNPELEYVKAEVKYPKSRKKEIWYLAQALAGAVVQAVAGKQIKVIDTFKGEKMKGWEYVHPWTKYIPEFKKLKKKYSNVHTILLSEEYVDTSAGSGLVHCAPGCGPEDYEIGHAHNIPPFNNIDEKGVFPEEMGPFAGKVAKKDDQFFVEMLAKDKILIATTPVEHEYAHCQRCHMPVVFRITPQWFFKVEDLKDKMVEANKKIYWNPETAKNGFTSWLNNLRDNSITKQRFWGTPLPIWKCAKCGEYEVFGSKAELEKRIDKTDKLPENLHKPWIDAVEFPCKKCKTDSKIDSRTDSKTESKSHSKLDSNSVMKRIPDVLDVWIDAGCASWNCLYYPQREDLLKEWYPAKFILEGKDQIRGWFNLLMVASMLGFNKPAFEKVYMHGFVTDIEGVKMSKSLGNITSPYEVIDKHGADGLRYYTCQNNAGEDLNFSREEAATKTRYLQILWNIQKLLINLSTENKANPFLSKKDIMYNLMDVEEKYILSRMHSTIKKVTELFEAYRLDETIKPLEELFLELSRTYIQMVRDKSSIGEDQEKEVVMYTISHVLMKCLQMFSVICPFICEAVYQNLKEEFALKEESIFYYPWPKADESKINPQLEENVVLAQSIIQSAANAREKVKLGLRWPVKELLIASNRVEVKKAVEMLNAIIKTQVNAKEIKVIDKLPGMKIKVRPDAGKIGRTFTTISAQVLGRLTIDSPETILGHLEKESVYVFEIEGKEVKITRDMLFIEHEVPKEYVEADFSSGYVYINVDRNDELEAEGYSREIMRNIQQLRKQAEFEKLDRINLYLRCSPVLSKNLVKFKSDIEQKVGAEKLRFELPKLALGHTSKFSVKTEQFEVWFEKV